jgi:serine/threonine protein kinase
MIRISRCLLGTHLKILGFQKDLNFKNGVKGKLISGGSHGSVSEWEYMGKIYAIKEIKFENRDEEESAEGEYKILQLCKDHPGFVKAHHSQKSDSIFTIIMDKHDLLEKFIDSNPPSRKDLLFKLETLYDGIDALLFLKRKNITHCDVKPKNTLCDENGKLIFCDFSIGDIKESTTSTILRENEKGTKVKNYDEILDFKNQF